MAKNFCIISHTHWDREWYMPLELFRLRLVDLMDNLLDILEQYPEFIFHLDAQTIVLEDYLEIRPCKKSLLKKHIKEGRLLVGPWYVQNDFFLTSGEATIRNLIIGSRIGDKMGKCSWVGYAPDQFGLISQLPQIFNGFGIDSCIFGRGYTYFKQLNGKRVRDFKPSEFLWETANGSKVLAIHLPFWYNNAQRFPKDINKCLQLLEALEKRFEGIALTPELLLMNGVDHLEAQEDLIPILKNIQAALPEDREIFQCTMQEYVDSVKNYFKENKQPEKLLQIYQGELRNGPDQTILQGTLSSRVYLKTANVRLQNLIENNIEPIYSFIQMLDIPGKYPFDFITYMWKELIKNHPHDSICGCSRDEVHNHMEDRNERIEELGTELLRRGMDFISAHISRTDLAKEDNIITVFNTSQEMRSEVIQIELQFLVEEQIKNFVIHDSVGNDIPFILLSKETKSRGSISPINLPGIRVVDAYTIQLFAQNIPSLGYKSYIVKPAPGVCHINDSIITSQDFVRVMENEFIRVEIRNSGSIDLLYKKTGCKYSDIMYLEDTADCGNAYTFEKAENDMLYTTKDITPEIICECDTEFEQRYVLKYDMKLPQSFDESINIRSKELISNKIDITVSLKKDQKWLDISFDIDNKSKDHRLRAIINTGINSDYSYTSTPFEVIKRDRKKILDGICNGDQPNSGMICVDGTNEGLAVLNEGLYEYEHRMDNSGGIAITLVRANEFIHKTMAGKSEWKVDETWHVPGNQCIRNIYLRAALYPYSGDHISENMIEKSKQFQNPLLVYFQPVDLKKFAGGRAAVQASGASEIFYREDPFKGYILSYDNKFIKINGDNLVLSALKKAEKGENLIIRIYNSTAETRKFSLEYYRSFKEIKKVDLKEDVIQELEFEGSRMKSITVLPGEIISLSFS